MYPYKICEIEYTAERLAEGNYIQGTNCPITKEKAYLFETNGGNGRSWYTPSRITPPTEEDRKKEKSRSEVKKLIDEKDLGEEEVELIMECGDCLPDEEY